MKKPIRAVAIIVKGDKVLLMWRKNQRKEYYVFPGGGVKENETIEKALLREVKEETSLEVKIQKNLYHHRYINDSDQYFYLCSYIHGEPEIGESNEKAEMKKGENFYKLEWVKIREIANLLLYPLEIRDWFIEDFKNNFANTPREASLFIKELGC